MRFLLGVVKGVIVLAMCGTRPCANAATLSVAFQHRPYHCDRAPSFFTARAAPVRCLHV
jgi:hypothetical protein